jgi:putative GTP pyrophosphokinase
MSEFDEIYQKRCPALARAEAQLRSLLEAVIGQIQDRKLVRAEFDDVRSKSLSELKSKAERYRWSGQDAFIRCSDLVGGRVVCNNVEDVYRFEVLLRGCLPADSGQIERQDYIDRPKRHGYRALHLNFRLNVSRTSDPELIPCEIQIRSRLQDAWAVISHRDIYKQRNLPLDLLDRVKDLSDLLAQADSTASSIRARVQGIVTPPDVQPKSDQISGDGLALIFKDASGGAPADHEVTRTLNLCDGPSIDSLTVNDCRVALGADRRADRRHLSTAKPPSSSPSPVPPTNWDIYLAKRTPAKLVGAVEASDVDAAIEKAAKEFDVRDPRRLIAVPRR